MPVNTLLNHLKFRSLKPRMHVPTIADLNAPYLRKIGIRGIVLDVDNTLTQHHSRELFDLIRPAYHLLSKNFRIVLYSNCNQARYRELRQMFHVPIVEPGLKKPSIRGFEKAAKLLNLPPQEIAMVGDRLLTDILGGNRAGFFTILVDPFPGKEPRILTWLRYLERRVFYRNILANSYES